MSKTIRSFDRRVGLAAIVLLLFVSAGLAPAAAQRPLDAPRANGTVGERYDGYAVLRKNASSDIQNLVKQTNSQRRAVYSKRAKATKTSIQAVGQIYAKEIMKSAPKGTWFQQQSGQWVQKK